MTPARFKKTFLDRIDGFAALEPLLNLLPDVAFFAKDRKGRFVMNNARSVESCGVATEAETLGKTDGDFFSDERASLYRDQDRQVMETGEPIVNAICPAPEKGANALIIFSKVPLRDQRGRIIGVAGIHREIRGNQSPNASLGRIARVVQTIHARYAEPLTIHQLAADARLSRSQFERVFREVFGAKPRDYLLRVRIHAACRLLIETSDKVTRVAVKTGFYDHSHFSRTFQRVVGMSPTVYRRRHESQRLLGHEIGDVVRRALS